MSGEKARPDEHDRRPEEADRAVLTGVGGAVGRDQYVGAQVARAERSARAQAPVAFDGQVHRMLPIRFTADVADHSRSGPGRYNAPGQSAFYAAPNLDAVRAEAHNYEALNGASASGLDGKSVVRGRYQGELLDLRATPGVSRSALEQPYGHEGTLRGTLSRITGEDAYTLPRALGDVARERNLGGVIVPANGGSTNIALFPDSPNQLAAGPGRFEAGFRPLEHTQFDAVGLVAGGRFNQPYATVPDGKPNKLSPPSVDNNGRVQGKDRYVEAVRKDTEAHTRAGGWRYGAAGAALASVGEGLATDHLDGRKVAADIAVGTAAGHAETALAHRIERVVAAAPVPPNVAGVTAGLEANAVARGAIRPPGLVAGAGAAGVVGAVVGAGVATWQNADAVKHHALMAGQATADVATQAGVGLAAGAAGAATGAAIGSVVPVAGTAVGAAVGFGAGVTASYAAGYVAQHSEALHAMQRAAGDYLTAHYEKPLQQAWRRVSEGVDGVRLASAAASNAVEGAASGAVATAEAAARRLTGASGAPPPAAAHDSHAAQDLWRAGAARGAGGGPAEQRPAAQADAAHDIWRRVTAAAPPSEHPAQQQAEGLRR